MDFIDIAQAWHLWIFSGLATLVSLVHAWRTHGKIWKIVKIETGSPRQEAISRLCLAWLVPFILALLTAVCLLGVSKADGNASELHRLVARLAPKSYKARLMVCLNKIDPGIIPALRDKNKNGKLQVYGYMNQGLYDELLKLSNEPEAAKYLAIVRSETDGLLLVEGKTGTSEHSKKVTLLLDKSLLDE